LEKKDGDQRTTWLLWSSCSVSWDGVCQKIANSEARCSDHMTSQNALTNCLRFRHEEWHMMTYGYGSKAYSEIKTTGCWSSQSSPGAWYPKPSRFRRRLYLHKSTKSPTSKGS
jgi:hypothetical protein